MISLEIQVLIAVIVDLMIGDPRWFPHPVRLIGNMAVRLEPIARRALPNPKAAGVLTALCVYGVTLLSVLGFSSLGAKIHPVIGDLVSIFFIYAAIATRDLAKHSMAVFYPLSKGDLASARAAVSMMVGRDTTELDEAGVTRAAIESVAENLVDGVTAPLFFALFAGAAGAMIYRAINTLDATFGYKNSKYIDFGWASARIDDWANLIPARLTGLLMPIASMFLGQRAGLSWQMMLRDRKKHLSPNSGFPESAMAGALGVQLGGISNYGGKPVVKPTLGEPLVSATPNLILGANALMFASMALFLAVAAGIRLVSTSFLRAWGIGS